MAVTIFFIFLLFLSLSFKPCSSSAIATRNCTFIQTQQEQVYDHCLDLGTLESTLQYTFNPSNTTLSVVFEAAPPSLDGWVAWGLNPNGTLMNGSQVVACYKKDNIMVVNTYNIQSYILVVPGNISYEVWGLGAEEHLGRMKIYGHIKLPVKVTDLNMIWQTGPSVTKNGSLVGHKRHPENLNSRGPLHLVAASSDSIVWWRDVHGGVSAICWGILPPMAILVARYGPNIPNAHPAWYYLYISCVSCASIGGMIGLAVGVVLGTKSEPVLFAGHLIVAIILGIFAIIQTVTLFQQNEAHNHRNYWSNFHHGIGYFISFFGIFNGWIGIEISKPAEKWIKAYGYWTVFLTIFSAIEVTRLFGCFCIKKWKERTGNRNYGSVEEHETSGMQPNPLD